MKNKFDNIAEFRNIPNEKIERITAMAINDITALLMGVYSESRFPSEQMLLSEELMSTDRYEYVRRALVRYQAAINNELGTGCGLDFLERGTCSKIAITDGTLFITSQ